MTGPGPGQGPAQPAGAGILIRAVLDGGDVILSCADCGWCPPHDPWVGQAVIVVMLHALNAHWQPQGTLR